LKKQTTSPTQKFNQKQTRKPITMTDAHNSQSILLIGATGRSGQEILHQLLINPTKPKIHVFCRNSSKLDPDYQKRCSTIIQGDARSVTDIERAVSVSDADTIIVAIGNGDKLGKTDTRTANAKAVATVMQQPGMEHVKAVVLSSTGAGSNDIIVGFGIGKLIEYHLRHILKDHDGQESAFLDSGLADRTVIIRPTSLTDGKANGKFVEFDDKVKSPTIHIDRGDVAVYAVQQACSSSFHGKTVNITGEK
jgi:putative NADH-flavin reductase